MSDVVVVGAGIIGCAIAAELARRGRSVVVVDRREPGAEASWAAAGILGAQTEADPRLLATLVEGRAMWPAFCAAHELDAETIEWRQDGVLEVATSDDEVAALATRADWQSAAGQRVERLSSAEVARLEPSLAPVRGGLWLRDDGAVDPRAVLRGLVAVARRRGGELVVGDARISGGVVEVSGRRVEAGVAIVACGVWSEALVGAPVTPMRGQMLALDAPSVSRVVVGASGYLVPRHGITWVGSTMEPTWEKQVTPDGLASLREAARGLVPSLASAGERASWAGLRPMSSDGMPIVDRCDGAVWACGHGRNGILLAPLTAAAVAGILDGAPLAATASWRWPRP